MAGCSLCLLDLGQRWAGSSPAQNIEGGIEWKEVLTDGHFTNAFIVFNLSYGNGSPCTDIKNRTGGIKHSLKAS